VVDNFGDDLGGENFEWARRTLAAPADTAVAALRERGVRYVVVEADGRWLGRAVGRESLQRALYEGDGADVGSTPALAHVRLVYETRGAVFTRESAPARYKVFERVAGARVEGQAAAGARVEATLDVSSARGRHFTVSAKAVADGEGAYRLRLPYATRGAPSGLRVAPHYQLRCGAIEAPLVVEEQAVQEGLAIPGPAACAAGLTPSHASADEFTDPRREHDPRP
jgi:asparagine N-glycosylation enzyme membrane subunit Stt3